MQLLSLIRVMLLLPPLEYCADVKNIDFLVAIAQTVRTKNRTLLEE